MASVYKTLSSSGAERESEVKKNKQRVLILSSRGVTYRHRHLLQDLYNLMPHSRKEAKFDSKTKLYQLNEMAELYNCNNVLFFEARKGKDLYCWMAKAPNGPTVKMHLQNLHTMDELNFIGNALKGSRPVLSFDAAFEKQAHLRLMKELFTQIFGVPKTARKTKPFVDHVMSFTVVNNKIWIRVYQINESETTKAKPTANGDSTTATPPSKKKPSSSTDHDINLVEIGPRFLLNPIVIMESSFGGPIIYQNKEFVSPNQIRSDLRRAKAGKYNRRTEAQIETRNKLGDLGLTSHGGKKKEKDPLSDSVLFA